MKERKPKTKKLLVKITLEYRGTSSSLRTTNKSASRVLRKALKRSAMTTFIKSTLKGTWMELNLKRITI